MPTPALPSPATGSSALPSRRALLGAAAVAAAAPALLGGTALAAGSAPGVRSTPLQGGRSAATPVRAGELVGVTWRDVTRTPVVEARLRAAGRWGAWRTLAPLESLAGVAAGGMPRGGVAPLGVARDGEVEVRVTGAAPGARLEVIDPGPDVAVALPHARVTLPAAGDVAAVGIVPRASWGANERRAFWTPVYGDTVKSVVVHHTVTSNAYSAGGAAAQVRGIFSYHAVSLGWGDIGYHFLVDRFGVVYEGRKGGLLSSVVGGHTYGFNHDTIGIALLGTYQGSAPSAAQTAALERLVTYVLARFHRDPAGTTVLGVDQAKNPRYRKGAQVRVRSIVAHRDLYPTSCCGSAAYRQIGSWRRAVDAATGPRVIDPVVTAGAVGSNATATLTAAVRKAVTWSAIARGPAGDVLGTWAGPPSEQASLLWGLADLPSGRSTVDMVATDAHGRGSAPATITASIVNPLGPRLVLPAGVLAAGADGTTWLVDDVAGSPGALCRRPVDGWVLATYPRTAERVVTEYAGALGQLPLGPPVLPRDGAVLVSADDGSAWVVSGVTVRRLVPGVGGQLPQGFSTAAATPATSAQIATLPQGADVVTTAATAAHPSGSVVSDGTSSYALVTDGGGSVRRRLVASTAARQTWVPDGAVLSATPGDRALPLDGYVRGVADGWVVQVDGGTVGIVSHGRVRPFTAASLAPLALPAALQVADGDLGHDAGAAPAAGTVMDLRTGPASASLAGSWTRTVRKTAWSAIAVGSAEVPPPVAPGEPARP